MKIVVTGDRHWDNYESIVDTFEWVCKEYGIRPTDITLIHGAARGLDSMAGDIGGILGMDVREYPPHWSHTDECPDDCKEMVGRPAGVIRNQKMLDDNPGINLALSFHNDLENSKGTLDMCKRVDKAVITRYHILGYGDPIRMNR